MCSPHLIFVSPSKPWTARGSLRHLCFSNRPCLPATYLYLVSTLGRALRNWSGPPVGLPLCSQKLRASVIAHVVRVANCWLGQLNYAVVDQPRHASFFQRILSNSFGPMFIKDLFTTSAILPLNLSKFQRNFPQCSTNETSSVYSYSKYKHGRHL